MFAQVIEDQTGSFVIRSFRALSTDDLYEILRARADIFVGEEKILYPDADGIDRRSLHVFSENEAGMVMSYLRIYEKKDEADTVQLGRVLTRVHGRNDGRRLLAAAVWAVRKYTSADRIYIESQKHAVGFYEKAGFVQVSDVFMEAGIPHVKMYLDLNKPLIS